MSETSVLIVTYNSEKFVNPCLEHLLDQTYQDFELIVADNASADGTLEQMKNQLQAFPSADLIRLTGNRGFAGGNIEALKQARGEFVALLNPDTEASPQWLESLVAVMRKHPDVGICASKLVVYGNGQIDSAGDGCLTTGAGYKRGEGQPAHLPEEPCYIFGACGGAVLLRRKMLDEIGFLDDDFFLIHEDTDLNFRAQLAGWKCFYVPDAVVEHKVRSTIVAASDLAMYYSLRNALYVWVKNMPSRLMLKYCVHQLAQQAGFFLFIGIRDHRLVVWYRAYRDFFRALPMLLHKRRTIMKMQRVSDKYIDGLLTSLFQHQRIFREWGARCRGILPGK